MTKSRRIAGAAVVMAVLGWASTAVATESGAAVDAQPALMAPDARVRGVTTRVVTVINEATAQSETFRGLVNQINSTDGIVYVLEGQCEHGVRACLLLAMTVMGPHRVLRILVDPRKADRDLIGSIGHELQHAIEVLSQRSISSGSAMLLLYKEMCNACALPFETESAIRAGNAVREEVRERALTLHTRKSGTPCGAAP